MLDCYYDVAYADRFDELFGGLAIHENPTSEHGKYLVMKFNFSQVKLYVKAFFPANISGQEPFVSKV